MAIGPEVVMQKVLKLEDEEVSRIEALIDEALDSACSYCFEVEIEFKNSHILDKTRIKNKIIDIYNEVGWDCRYSIEGEVEGFYLRFNSIQLEEFEKSLEQEN